MTTVMLLCVITLFIIIGPPLAVLPNKPVNPSYACDVDLKEGARAAPLRIFDLALHSFV